jgi:hypothetical protein
MTITVVTSQKPLKRITIPAKQVISAEHGFAISTRRFVEVGQTGDALLQLMCGLKKPAHKGMHDQI